MEKPKKLALVTNMTTPYRAPFFKALAQHEKIAELTVYICVEREADREWDVNNDSSYIIRKMPGITLTLNKGVDAKRIMHFRVGILWLLLLNRPDMVIIGDASWTSFIAAFACRLWNIPYVVWNEITTSSKVSKGMVSKLRRWMYRGASRCVAACTLAKHFLLQNEVPEHKIGIVNNAVDNEFFISQRAKWESSRELLRSELSISPDAFCFIYVGQLISRKRVMETLELLANVSKQRSVHLIVAGTGPLENLMKKRAADLEFLSINFCGYTQPERLCQLYIASDALILLSDDEPWGMVVNEALLMGKPFFVSENVGAGVDLIQCSPSSKVVRYDFEVEADLSLFIENAIAYNRISLPMSATNMSEAFLGNIVQI